jgi:hypothetical protein
MFFLTFRLFVFPPSLQFLAEGTFMSSMNNRPTPEDAFGSGHTTGDGIDLFLKRERLCPGGHIREGSGAI